MTNFTTRMMIAAATVAVAAGAASAQTLKAEIPFPFRAGTAVMAAGTYNVDQLPRLSGNPMFRVSAAGQRTILLMPVAAGDVSKPWAARGTPTLAFACTANGCSLSQIWTGASSAPAYQIPQGKMDRNEPVRVALVEMHSDKSE